MDKPLVLTTPVSAAGHLTREGIVQIEGYTHFSQTGQALNRSERTTGVLSRYLLHLGETVSSAIDNISSTSSANGLSSNSVRALTDPKKETTWQYLMLHQLLAGYIPDSVRELKNIITSAGKPVDDRKLQLEDVVAFLARAGKSKDRDPVSFLTTAQGQFINLLWNDLPHPPAADISLIRRFRSADDSGNNPFVPLLGAAGQPYARSVAAMHPLPPSLPTPPEIFDALLRRPNYFQPHPAGISSMLFAFATIIIHDIFWTSQKQPWLNLTSSYLSLSPLYGVNEAEQTRVRDITNLGRGLLYPDTFSSDRILMMPPTASALLVIFSRNHNRVAKKVLELNERNEWSSNLKNLSHEQLKAQDDAIFGTARMVNCGYFVNIMLGDYLQAILGTVQTDSDWKLDPRMEVNSLLGKTPSGGGQACSVEFNTLYRWHAPLSAKDTAWLEDKMALGRPDRNWDALTSADLGKASLNHKTELNAMKNGKLTEPNVWKLSKYENSSKDVDQEKKTYRDGVYERDVRTGSFKDVDVATILKEATNEIAGAYGARHTPAVFKLIDVMGMTVAREKWRTCTLNEFRRFLNLKTFDTFLEWNSDPVIAKAAEDIYGFPDNIELYPGLMAEEVKKPRVGAGLCANYTLTRAIMSDAVALVRGDSYYNSRFTVHELTQWGLNDCQPDPNAGSYGGILHKLLEENLPNQYVFNDVALLFPFQVPDTMMKTLAKIPNKVEDYVANVRVPPLVGLYTAEENGVKYLFQHPSAERIENARMRELVGNLCGNNYSRSNLRAVFDALNCAITSEEIEKFGLYLDQRIFEASTQRGPETPTRTVNISRDVTTPVIVGFLAHVFGVTQTGLHSRQHMMCALSDLYEYLHESPRTFKGRQAGRLASTELFGQLKLRIDAANPTGSALGAVKQTAADLAIGALNVLDSAVRVVTRQDATTPTFPVATAFYEALIHKNRQLASPFNAEELASDCLQAMALLAFTLANSASASIDYLLDAGPATDTVKSLAKSRDGLADVSVLRKLERLGAESVRLNHWDPVMKYVVVELSQVKKVPGKPLGRIVPEFKGDLNSVAYSRLTDIDGFCLPLLLRTLPVVLQRVFGGLDQVARAPGMQGHLRQIILTASVAKVPTLVIQYNGKSPAGRGRLAHETITTTSSQQQEGNGHANGVTRQYNGNGAAH